MVYAIEIGKVFGPAENFGTLAGFLNVIIPNLMLLAGIIFFVLLVAGGFMFIAGAGGGDANQTGKGQKAITYALIGFIIIFVSYWIIQIVEKVTGIDIFNPDLG